MGEQVQPEQPPPPAEDAKPQVDQKQEDAPPPPPPAEEPKPPAEEEPKPPAQPFVLYVDLHCVGCAKKIEKSIMRLRGVEGVVIDMSQNQVTIKGIVEPQAVCNKIMKKTKRMAKVLSPLPVAEGEPMPQVVTSQVSAPITVELNVNMHCEACADQLKKKILKMRGVQTAQTEFTTGKVIVTGTMDANKLVDYVYRRTKKHARIVPQPEPEAPPPPPPPPEEPKPPEEEKKAEDQKPPEGGEPNPPPPDNNNPTDKPPENNPNGDKPPEGGEQMPPPEQEPNKDGGGGGDKLLPGEGAHGVGPNIVNEYRGPMLNEYRGPMPPPPHHFGFGGPGGGMGYHHQMMMMNQYEQEESMRRMMYYHQPLYVIERVPAPQLFSDENPNACCIS